MGKIKKFKGKLFLFLFLFTSFLIFLTDFVFAAEGFVVTNKAASDSKNITETTKKITAGSDPYAHFDEYVGVAKNQANAPASAINTFDPNATFKNYTDHPGQTQYYGGVTQSNTNIDKDASQAVTQDNAAQSVNKSFLTRPIYNIDTKSDTMKQSNVIEQNAYDIAHGVSDKYVDCSKEYQQCTKEYETKTCNTANNAELPCTKDLTEDVQQSVKVDEVVSFNLSGQGVCTQHSRWLRWWCLSYQMNANVDLTTGQISSDNGSSVSGSVSPTLGSISCTESSADHLSSAPSSGTSVTTTQTPACTNHFVAKVVLVNASSANMSTLERFKVIAKTTPVIHEYWQNNCNNLESLASQGGLTRTSQNVCTQGKETRVIQGLSFTKDCWQTTDTYQIQGAGQQENTCKPYQDQHCEQKTSTCAKKIGDICTNYQNTYQCLTKEDCKGEGLVCGGDFYCISGDCTSHNPKPNANFGKDISDLAAVGAAGKDVSDKQSMDYAIFTGHTMDCRKDGYFNWSNCCNDSGWGQDIGLAHCSDEEKQLGQAKEKGLAIYVDWKCDEEYPWPLHGCAKKSYVYCTFDSKLARITQEQGRSGQLHIGFGDGDNPNCRGLSPTELQQIDFSKIDFTDVYSDIQNNMNLPNNSAVQQAISKKIHGFYQVSKK